MVTKDGHNSAFYLTNAMELLDEPGEWYHYIESRKIYYYPRKGEKISKAVVPGIETLVWVEGTIDRPVKHIPPGCVPLCKVMFLFRQVCT